MRTFLISAGLVAVVVAVVLSQFAFDGPDGLERVALDTGFSASARDHDVSASPFADYATSGVSNPRLSLALAGLAGVVLTLLVGYGLARAGRIRPRPDRRRDRLPVLD